MPNTRTLSILLAAAVAVTGALLYLQAEEPAAGTIILDVESPDVVPPDEIRGVAMRLPTGHVDVTATIDGEEIDADEMMEGDANEFSFPTTNEMKGKTVVVTATGADGQKTSKFVHVR